MVSGLANPQRGQVMLDVVAIAAISRPFVYAHRMAETLQSVP
jgi:hypothetical protein